MKKTSKVLGITTFIAVIAFNALLLTGCSSPESPPPVEDPKVVATPTANPAAGTYTSAQSVTLSSATTGATIYYTTNGSTPTTSSTAYSAAINISATTTLKAFAVKEGLDDSGILTAAYTITGSVPVTSATELIMGKFAEGNIPTTNGVEWFTFTTEAAQTSVYIHLLRGAMSSGKVTLYAEDRTTAVGAVDTTLGNTSNMQRTVTASTTYFIKVTPNTGSGKYRIGVVNSTSATPVPSITIPTTGVTNLASDTWVNGNIADDGEENWYKLTSTGTAQNIFVDLITMLNLNAQLYDEDGTAVGTEKLFGRGGFSPTGYSTSITVDNSKVYYIRATHYSSGTYKIASTSGSSSTTTAPALTVPTSTATNMTDDTWTNGSITTAGGEQWFKFTATAASHYIHLQLGAGTLDDIVFQLVDSTGKTAGTGNLYNLSSSNISISRTGLTASTVYYVRVNPYLISSGTFKIGVNTTEATPVITPSPVPTTGVTQLTAVSTWTNGNIATANGEEWFKFTATKTGTGYSDYQYIHFQPGTLTQVYAQLYTSDGRQLGARSSLSSGTYSSYMSRTLTTSAVYHIKVWPYSSSSGTGAYKMAFSESSTTPTP